MSKIKTDDLALSKTVLLRVDFINPLTFDGATELTRSTQPRTQRGRVED